MTKYKIAPELARSFADDMAARFDLPEIYTTDVGIPTTELDERLWGKDSLIFKANIQPKGQMAAIVYSLEVVIVVYGTDVKGLYQGNVSMSYKHHGGGSNGKDTKFYINTDSKYGGSKVEYLGAVEVSTFNGIQQKIENYRDSLED